jgi:hypothetical protein
METVDDDADIVIVDFGLVNYLSVSGHVSLTSSILFHK